MFLKKLFNKLTGHVDVKIRYHNGVAEIRPISLGDWVDLRAAETVTMKRGEYKMISLGVSMELPKGYEAHVLPRSSTYRRYGIVMANSMGIVDNAYRGDDDVWQFPAIALADTEIRKDERIAQFRIEKIQPTLKFKAVDRLDNANRGGFGSTGRL